MKKSSKGTNPCGYTESVSKSKSRIKRLEKHNAEGCNHRLANSYANNNPGDLDFIKSAFSPSALEAHGKQAKEAFTTGIARNIKQAGREIKEGIKSLTEPPFTEEDSRRMTAELDASQGVGRSGRGSGGGGGRGY